MGKSLKNGSTLDMTMSQSIAILVCCKDMMSSSVMSSTQSSTRSRRMTRVIREISWRKNNQHKDKTSLSRESKRQNLLRTIRIRTWGEEDRFRLNKYGIGWELEIPLEYYSKTNSRRIRKGGRKRKMKQAKMVRKKLWRTKENKN